MGSSAAGIEEQVRAALVRRLAWTVRRSNDEELWARVRDTATNLLSPYWRDGELKGSKPEDAFYVRCGRETMTQQDVNDGRLIVEVGIAPVAPAEFVIVTIEQRVAGQPKRSPFRRWFTRSCLGHD
jgi:phage tail sheath protein FI